MNTTKISLNPRKGIYECCAINRAGIGCAVIHLTVKEMEYFRSVVNDRIVSVDELKDAYLSGKLSDSHFYWSLSGDQSETGLKAFSSRCDL